MGGVCVCVRVEGEGEGEGVGQEVEREGGNDGKGGLELAVEGSAAAESVLLVTIIVTVL